MSVSLNSTGTLLWQLLNLFLLFGIPAILAILLQIYLSKRISRIPGLILPALHILMSLVLILSFGAYSFEDASYSVTTVTEGGGAVVQDEHGNILSISSFPEEIEATADDSAASVGIIGGADGPTAIFVSSPTDYLSILLLFMLLNIPTVLYLLIYFLQRRKLSHRNTVNKTLIQDL